MRSKGKHGFLYEESKKCMEHSECFYYACVWSSRERMKQYLKIYCLGIKACIDRYGNNIITN